MKKGIFLFSFLLLNFNSPTAWALTVLKDVSVFDGERVDLKFDRHVKEKQIKTEFFRDIIQISIKNVAVYPAKIFSVNGKHLRKVFAYQYTPKLIRCRLTVDGDAEKYKDRVVVGLKGSTITVKIKNDNNRADEITLQAAQAVKKPKSENQKKISDETGIKEKKLLKEVLGRKEPEVQKTGKLTGGKAIEFPVQHLAWLVLVLISAVTLIFFIKKARNRKNQFETSYFGRKFRRWIGRMGLQNKVNSNQIRVLSKQEIGQNAQIVMVEIEGRKLILGVTSENVNVISGEQSQLLSEEESGSAGPSSDVIKSSFSDILQNESLIRGKAINPKNQDYLNSKRQLSVREQIRRRIEGMKSL